MAKFFTGFAIAFVVGGLVIGSFLFWSRSLQEKTGKDFTGALIDTLHAKRLEEARAKTEAELIQEAYDRSSDIRGLYMTADVANDPGVGATRLRSHIIKLAKTTEINGIVIDVKEVCGPDYDEGHLKMLLDELHANNIWAIARIAVMKDASKIETHPSWYLQRKAPIATGTECGTKRYLREKAPEGTKMNVVLWQDKGGGYWMDPASLDVRNYVIGVGEKMIDLGFDELQFDYLRFPSDGDISNAIYPVWDHTAPKYEVMKSFFENLHDKLKAYKPSIILSADLFGYVAAQKEELSIGQRLEDIGKNFDYISFMVYPSHYYNGLVLPADPARNLPAINYSVSQARTNPGVVVERSLLIAKDFLDQKMASSTVALASTTPTGALPQHTVQLRPWLEDFFHEQDREASRPYGAEKVRLQIEGAGRVEQHGWLLWNAANTFSDDALKKEGN